MKTIEQPLLGAIATYLKCEVKDIVSAKDDGQRYIVLVNEGIAGTPRYFISYENVKPKTPKPKAAPETKAAVRKPRSKKAK